MLFIVLVSGINCTKSSAIICTPRYPEMRLDHKPFSSPP
jgi:hypothetical protein